MTRLTIPEDARRPRLLIPDNSPLSLLALIGEAALDWLFVPGAEVWITDMIAEEAQRDPDPGSDRRKAHRAVIRNWLDRNRDRIRIQRTDAGREYRKAMDAWKLAGEPPALRPSWAGRGDASLLQALDAAAGVTLQGESVVVLADDRRLRAALRLMDALDIDLMATESFIAWMVDGFGIPEAETAWATIVLAAGGKAPGAPKEDPVHIRPVRR